MSGKAQSILEEFKSLPPDEQREVTALLLRQLTTGAAPFTHRRTIADIAGKYHASPDADAKDHDRGFAGDGTRSGFRSSRKKRLAARRAIP